MDVSWSLIIWWDWSRDEVHWSNSSDLVAWDPRRYSVAFPWQVGGSAKIASLVMASGDSRKVRISRHLLSTLAWGFSSKVLTQISSSFKTTYCITSGEVFLCATELTRKSENNSLRGTWVLGIKVKLTDQVASAFTYRAISQPQMCLMATQALKGNTPADMNEEKWQSFVSQPEHWHGATWTILQGWQHHRAHSGLRGRATNKKDVKEFLVIFKLPCHLENLFYLKYLAWQWLWVLLWHGSNSLKNK